jgi:hypothetical protein
MGSDESWYEIYVSGDYYKTGTFHLLQLATTTGGSTNFCGENDISATSDIS